MKKLSIITVNLNNLEGLRKTIESVCSQSFASYEYIVIDGGSTDGSKEYIRQNARRFSHWVSEPDYGIYYAMNKGIDLASGDYCLFLNSGDYLVNPQVLERFFSSNPEEAILYGNLETSRGFRTYSPQLSYYTFFHGTITHQAVFIKRELFERYGKYNESLSIVADWEFFIKALIGGGCSYRYINETVCWYDVTGISSVSKYQAELASQRERVLKEYYPMMYDDYKQMVHCREELAFYQRSRLAQWVKKIHNSWIFKLLRGGR